MNDRCDVARSRIGIRYVGDVAKEAVEAAWLADVKDLRSAR
jgi:hypothetical protein